MLSKKLKKRKKLLGCKILVAALIGLFPMSVLAQDASPVFRTKMVSEDETRTADIELINGKNRLITSSITVIEQLFGRDPQATSWFYIGTDVDADGVGLAGDTVRVQIPAAVSPIGTTLYPAVDVTTTVTTDMVIADNPEQELAKKICSNLNLDANFKAAEWKCEVIKDHSGVFISSKLFNEWGERTSWSVTSTGTTVVTKAFDGFERRGLPTELARSPNNPRQGVLAISGSVVVQPSAISDQFQEHALNGGKSLNVDGSVTPVEFRVLCDPVYDKYITNMRMWFQDNGIKFGQFMGINGSLANGIDIIIRSQNLERTLLAEPIRTTEDFQIHLADPITLFNLHVQSGLDMAISETIFENPFIVSKCGTYPVDDYILVKIQDNLTSIVNGEFLVFGFRKEP